MRKIYLILFLSISIGIYSENLKVTYVNTNPPGDPFWDKVAKYMELAAKDLEIDLKVVYPSVRHRLAYRKLIFEQLNSNEKPDYIIIQLTAQITETVLELAEEKKVYVFTFNSNVPEREKNYVKSVNEKYKYWIGHIFPDDFNAGYRLGKALIEEARVKNLRAKDGKIHILGLTGGHDSTVAGDRNKGLEKAVKESRDVVLSQNVVAYWDSEKAYNNTFDLLRRYPKTNVIWAASDAMALGAAKAVTEIGEILGEDIIFGGIDWSDEGVEGIRNGTLSSSAGGHFLEGVTSLILVKDHSEGVKVDFKKYPIKTKLEIMTKENMEKYESILSYENFREIDFKKMSKYYNKELIEFNYNLLNEISK